MTLIKKTSLLSDSRFPSFIKDNPEYDMLRRFVQSYFESLEQEGGASFEIANSRENSDIDSTTENYLSRIFEELCPNLPKNIISNKRFLLKHSRELYEKKGTPDSFKMLFRILFNESISLKYPNENILRASDGVWNQPVAMQVKITSHPTQEVLKLVNQEITAINGSGIVRNFIRQVRSLGNGVYEFIIDKQKNLQFLINDVVTANNISGYVLPMPSKIKIIKPGRKFTPGQLIKLDIDSSIGTIAKVTSTTSEGAIKTLQIIKFGIGYESDFSLTVSPSKNKAATRTTTTELSGPNLPLSDYGNGFIESGTISQTGKLGPQYDYFLEDYVETEYISSIIRQFISITPPPIDNDGVSEEDYAIINIFVGATSNYPGFWANNRGNLSDPFICLQDNDFYQDFSYVIQSSVARSLYVKHVKETIHPAGLKMFSDLLLDNTIDISSTIANIDPMAYRMYINDIVDAPDMSKYFMTMPKEDSVENSEFIEKEYIKNTSENMFAVDEVSRDAKKTLADSTNAVDNQGFLYGLTFNDYVDNGEQNNYVDEGFVNDLYTTQSNGPSVSIESQKFETINTNDSNKLDSSLYSYENITANDSNINNNQSRILNDSTSIVDVFAVTREITINDTTAINETVSKNSTYGLSETINISDNNEANVSISANDTIGTTDTQTKTQNISLNDFANTGELDKYFEDGYTNDYYTVQSTGITIS